MWWCGVDDGLVAVLSGIGRGPTQDHKDVAGDTFAEEGQGRFSIAIRDT